MLVQASTRKRVYEYPYETRQIIALKSKGYKTLGCKGNQGIYKKERSFVVVDNDKVRVYIYTTKLQFERELESILDKYKHILYNNTSI